MCQLTDPSAVLPERHPSAPADRRHGIATNACPSQRSIDASYEGLFLLLHPTLLGAMSTMNRLLGVLGRITSNEKDSQWGNRRYVKLSDRRSSPRHMAFPNEARLGWWVGEGFHSVAAEFHDISLCEARIFTADIPMYKHVWIGLARPLKTRWCPVRVIRVRELALGLTEVGLAFNSTCDSALFEALVRPDRLA